MGCHYVCVFFITNVIPCPDNKEWPRIWAKQFRQQIKLVMLSISVMPTSTWVTHLCINIRGLPQIVDGDGCAVVLSQYRLELGHPPHGDTPERLGPFLLVTNFPVHSMGDTDKKHIMVKPSNLSTTPWSALMNSTHHHMPRPPRRHRHAARQ